MKREQLLRSVAAGCESALVGGMVGLLAAAYGNVASGSPAGVAATLVIATALGARASGWAGAFCGAWCGVVFIGLAMAIGDSTAGVVTMTIVSALLAAWFDWLVSQYHQRRKTATSEERSQPSLQPMSPPAARRDFSRIAAAQNYENRMVQRHLYKECLL